MMSVCHCEDGPATLFSYPDAPGTKAGAPETSRIAAARVAADATVLRQKCIDVLARHPDGLTADEVAAALNLSVLSIRPRMSELRQMNRIQDSGQRRKNASGHSAAVWRAYMPVKEPLPKPEPPELFDGIAVPNGPALKAIRGR